MKNILCFYTFIFVVINAFSSPAPHFPLVFEQPDGTKITITLHGDEYLHHAQTTDGYTALFDAEGYYVYAIKDSKGNLVPSAIQVHEPGERNIEESSFVSGLEKGLFFSEQQISQKENSINNARTTASPHIPAKGKHKFICILVNYPEKKFTHSKNEISQVFNKTGYSLDGATGSFRDYYLEVSYNQLEINTDVYGPYTLSHEEAYYGSSVGAGYPKEIATEALKLADPDINYALYDNDGNGVVEGVYIIAAGRDQHNGGGEEAIWPHAAKVSSTPSMDGMKFSRYACSGEIAGDDGKITHIGVICHETGHLLGSPDFYGDWGGLFTGTGLWDLMGTGNGNNMGRTPAHPNAFVKSKIFNWVIPTRLSMPFNNVELTNSEENKNSYYYMNTRTPDEYFLLENRTKTGFDRYLPGEGLIIYHVHSDLATSLSDVNTGHPQKMYPVCAGSGKDPEFNNADSYEPINTALCPFPGEKNIRGFTYYTLPSSKSWADEQPYGHLTNIAFDKSKKLVSFDFMRYDPYNLKVRAMSSSKIRLSWQTLGEQEVVISRAKISSIVSKLPGGVVYKAGDYITFENQVVYVGKANEFVDSGLDPSTTYYYHLWGKVNGIDAYMDPLRGSVATKPDITKEFVKDFNELFNSGTRQYWENIGYRDVDSEWQFDCDGSDPKFGCTAITNYNSELVSPTVICVGYDSVKLSFDHQLSSIRTFTATVYYTFDNGNTWNTVSKWKDELYQGESTYVIPTNGAEKIRFKWVLEEEKISLWEISYVSITSFNSQITGIKDDANTSISVYPVPTEGSVNIKMTGLSGDVEIRLYNLCGALVYQEHIADAQRSPIHTFSTDAYRGGIYLLKVNTDRNSFFQKVIINN